MNENKEEFSTRKKIVHIVIVILAIALFFGGVYGLLVWTGLWDKVNSVDKVKNLILSMGFYGRTIFVLLQFLQVTFLPIPASVLVRSEEHTSELQSP